MEQLINDHLIIDSFTDSFVHNLENVQDQNENRDSLSFMTFTFGQLKCELQVF